MLGFGRTSISNPLYAPGNHGNHLHLTLPFSNTNFNYLNQISISFKLKFMHYSPQDNSTRKITNSGMILIITSATRLKQNYINKSNIYLNKLTVRKNLNYYRYRTVEERRSSNTEVKKSVNETARPTRNATRTRILSHITRANQTKRRPVCNFNKASPSPLASPIHPTHPPSPPSFPFPLPHLPPYSSPSSPFSQSLLFPLYPPPIHPPLLSLHPAPPPHPAPLLTRPASGAADIGRVTLLPPQPPFL